MTPGLPASKETLKNPYSTRPTLAASECGFTQASFSCLLRPSLEKARLGALGLDG